MRLEVIEATCGYEKGSPVLVDVGFSLGEGETMCVLGPNGCGKSTLLDSILGITPLMSGRVLVDGQDTKSWSASRVAQVMAYVSQDHHPPFSYLVKDVVMLGRVNDIGVSGKASANDLHIVDECMQAMGVWEMRERPYTELSGGELQLVMIARALAQQPSVLVLDEPTAALDYGNAMRVIDKVRSLGEQGICVIMTTHNPDHAFMLNSKVLLLAKGAHAQFGPAVEMITQKNLRAAYGVNVKIVEFEKPGGGSQYLCAPVVSTEPEGV